MKRLALLIAALLSALSCSLDRYRSPEFAEVRLQVPPEFLKEKGTHILGNPSSYTTIDCFLLDVNGPGIDAMYDENNPYAVLDLGMNSGWVARTALVTAGSTSMTIKVPIGRSRT